jgi:hypothetical protein
MEIRPCDKPVTPRNDTVIVPQPQGIGSAFSAAIGAFCNTTPPIMQRMLQTGWRWLAGSRSKQHAQDVEIQMQCRLQLSAMRRSSNLLFSNHAVSVFPILIDI